MYLSELRISNFRRFGIKTDPTGGSEKPGLVIHFNEGLNLLIGENDSGKTAIIDAIKLVILTESREYYRLEYEDFHIHPGQAAEEARTKSLKIECIFRGFENKHNEAKNFLEWLGIEKTADGTDQYYLRVFLKGERVNRRIYYDVKAGPDEEGTILDSAARDLLRAIYLKPLRDAESELIPGRRSRLAQILDAHESFNISEQEHHLLAITKRANKAIKNYFQGLGEDDATELEDQSGKKLLKDINTYLTEFFTEKEKNKIANFSITDPNLKSILERLTLDLIETKAGLGSYNRLYIATELLLLRRENYSGLKLGLIEEIEAHLHPQAQLRLIEYLQEEISGKTDVQLIITSHSPNLSSKVNLENLIVCKNDNAFSMDSSSTELESGDYLYLQRFLDVTKANLFFAQGVMLVEGDAENILMPTIAELIEKPLSKFGVSIVNVNSTAFLRYSRIFRRKNVDEGEMGIPVSVVTDNDINPDSGLSEDEINKKRKEKEERYDGQGVRTFISPVWTLEYDICLSGLKQLFYTAVLRAEKIQNSNKIGLTEDKIKEVSNKVKADFTAWKTKTDQEIAYEIYVNNVIKNDISKAIISQSFAEILKNENQEELKGKILKDKYLRYLVDSIDYACG
jgi:putative ATP-dependent endonuclease of OLD family